MTFQCKWPKPRSCSDTSSIWNFSARSPDVISRGNHCGVAKHRLFFRLPPPHFTVKQLTSTHITCQYKISRKYIFRIPLRLNKNTQELSLRKIKYKAKMDFSRKIQRNKHHKVQLLPRRLKYFEQSRLGTSSRDVGMY